MKTQLKMAAIATAFMLSGTAQAALIADLSFVQPTGTVFSNQAIDVVLRLTLDSASDALTTDGSATPTSGFDPLSYAGPIDLNDPNTRIFISVGAECSGTFDPCGNPNYQFGFNFAQPNLIAPTDFDLQPGQSFDWVLGSFTPIGGNATPGTYTFYNAGVHFEIFNPGADLFDSIDDQTDFLNFGETCRGQSSACAFTRQVLAAPTVPEPATWAMMIAGFGLVGAGMRRRTSHSVLV